MFILTYTFIKIHLLKFIRTQKMDKEIHLEEMTLDEKYNFLFKKFDEFFDGLFKIYPNEENFAIYRNKIWLGKNALGKKEVCERLCQSLIIFEHEIKHENDEFFVNYPLDEISAFEEHMEFVKRLKDIWTSSSQTTKNNIWLYLQGFISIFLQIYDDIELLYIKLKGYIALISSSMKCDVVGGIIYWQYLKQVKFCQDVKDEEFILEFADLLQKHKPQLKKMQADKKLTEFLNFDPDKHYDPKTQKSPQHSGFLDWIEHNWNNYNLLVKSTTYRLCLSIIKMAQIIKHAKLV